MRSAVRQARCAIGVDSDFRADVSYSITTIRKLDRNVKHLLMSSRRRLTAKALWLYWRLRIVRLVFLGLNSWASELLIFRGLKIIYSDSRFVGAFDLNTVLSIVIVHPPGKFFIYSPFELGQIESQI